MEREGYLISYKTKLNKLVTPLEKKERKICKTTPLAKVENERTGAAQV